MRKVVILLVCLSALTLPLAAQELWLGAGGLVIPETGNLAYSTAHQELQLSAGWFQPAGKRFALNFGLATDTVDAQRWLVRHAFTDGPVAEWSRRYYALDVEAHYLLTPGSRLAVTAFVGPSLMRSGDITWGGLKAGVLGRYSLGEHLTAGAEVACRHADAGPCGAYTVGEVALRVGWRF